MRFFVCHTHLPPPYGEGHSYTKPDSIVKEPAPLRVRAHTPMSASVCVRYSEALADLDLSDLTPLCNHTDVSMTTINAKCHCCREPMRMEHICRCVCMCESAFDQHIFDLTSSTSLTDYHLKERANKVFSLYVINCSAAP